MCEGHLGKLESDRGVVCVFFSIALTLIGRAGGERLGPSLLPPPFAQLTPSWLFSTAGSFVCSRPHGGGGGACSFWQED